MAAHVLITPSQRQNIDIYLATMSMDLTLQVDLLALKMATKQRRRKRRSVWTRNWLLRRQLYGHYENIMHEFMREDHRSFRNFTRLDVDMFWEMVEKITPRIERQDTFWRKSLSPALRLAITLRYLATGDSYQTLSYDFRVAHNSISLLVPDTCEAIYQEYHPLVLPCPKTPEDWKKCADLFEERWQFPHAVGAIDGKHIAIRCPANAGSLYYNYKGFHSIVLMAVVDADYKFLYCDVGATGSGSDGGVFAQTPIRAGLENNTLGLPPPQPLHTGDRPVPYFLLADDAFPMRPWLLKPFPHRSTDMGQMIFSYRLSRARRVVENAFGILANRFRCLLTTIPLQPKRVESVVLACCCLHNLIRRRFPSHHAGFLDRENPRTHRVTPGSWRDGDQLEPLMPLTGNQATNYAKELRRYMADYFTSPRGSVSWQDRRFRDS